MQTVFCQRQEINLVNVVSAVLFQLPGTVSMISLTQKHSKKQFKSILLEHAFSRLLYGAPECFVEWRPTNAMSYCIHQDFTWQE